MDGRGEEALNGFIFTADRGYGKQSFMKILIDFGLASVFVMPDHLLNVHTFFAASFLNPARGDIEEGAIKMYSERSTADRSHGALSTDQLATAAEQDKNAITTNLHANTEQLEALPSNCNFELNRRKDFVVNDNPP